MIEIKRKKSATEQAVTKQQRPFTAPTNPARDYRKMYGEIFRFHERHNPPLLNDDYWMAVGEDIAETAYRFDNDPFFSDLLDVVFKELERQYREMIINAEEN